MSQFLDPSKIKAFVGLSGGVDSAVSAALLKQQGYDVTGVFMKNWSGDDYGIQADCPWEEDQKMAESVCQALGISFRSYNFEKQYREKVVEYFFSEYQKGRTPNPDVMCNREIKFDLFLNRALQDGADMIATGHYARVEKLGAGSQEMEDQLPTPNSQLLKGTDPKKDQTYFLYTLDQDRLSRVLFPIGHLPKSEVRQLAAEFKLPNFNRPDSQGICFIGEINVAKYLRAQLPVNKGEIRDIDTQEVVGEHDGVAFYTLGQREGLGIGGQEIPYFVVSKDFDQNILYVGHGHNHPALLKKTIKLENLHLIQEFGAGSLELENLSAAVRYQQRPLPGKLDVENLTFTFDEPVWAATPGQSLVIYDDDVCLGGGVIA